MSVFKSIKWGGPSGTASAGMRSPFGSATGSVAKGFASTQGSPAPAASTAAPAPGPAPWDTAYESSVSNLNLNRSNALAAIAAQRTQTSQNFGFNADGSENTTDPFSRLANLKADYEKIKRGTSTSYAARGLGYDGSYQNAVNSNYDSNLRNTDSLKKDFQSANTALNNQELAANSQYNTDLNAAMFNRAQIAAQNVATGQDPATATAAAPTRRDKVLGALSGNLGPAVRKRLQAEARQNGWI